MNTNQDIRFFYVRSDNGRVLTVARRLSSDRLFVEFAYSVNRPGEDQFSKRIGREIALGRLNSGKSTTVSLVNNFRPIEAVLEHLAYDSEDVPQCVQELAKTEFLKSTEKYKGSLNSWDAYFEAFPDQELFLHND